MKNNLKKIILTIGLIILSACSGSPRFTNNEKNAEKEKTTVTKPDVKPEHAATRYQNYSVLEIQEGLASYYGDDFQGKPTASGEIFNMYDLTAAHQTYPLGTIARVTNLRNKKNVIVKINDRGPFIDGRILDLSYGAAKMIGAVAAGVVEVRIEVIEWGNN